MTLHAIRGVFARRILINFRVDPAIVRPLLPEPFKPLLVDGAALAGVCLIRLENLRPSFLPIPWGLNAEGAAHRVAVTWKAGSRHLTGTYMFRRESSSPWIAWAGGRLFPGEHRTAQFTIKRKAQKQIVRMTSPVGHANVALRGQPVDHWNRSSVFNSATDASCFFRDTSFGVSPNHRTRAWDGVTLECDAWDLHPFRVDYIDSAFYHDKARFPPGSIELDSALWMRRVSHVWRAERPLIDHEPQHAGFKEGWST